MNAITDVAEESYDGLMDPKFYSGVAGIAIGGVLGGVVAAIAIEVDASWVQIQIVAMCKGGRA